MKYLDKVKVLVDCDEYSQQGVVKGMIGTIIDAEIRDNCFHVIFVDQRTLDENFVYSEKTIIDLSDDIYIPIKIEDLDLVEESKISDKLILQALPKQNKNWWCKVEDGYILNLNGNKKNKVPYDYNS